MLGEAARHLRVRPLDEGPGPERLRAPSSPRISRTRFSFCGAHLAVDLLERSDRLADRRRRPRPRAPAPSARGSAAGGRCGPPRSDAPGTATRPGRAPRGCRRASSAITWIFGFGRRVAGDREERDAAARSGSSARPPCPGAGSRERTCLRRRHHRGHRLGERVGNRARAAARDVGEPGLDAEPRRREVDLQRDRDAAPLPASQRRHDQSRAAISSVASPSRGRARARRAASSSAAPARRRSRPSEARPRTRWPGAASRFSPWRTTTAISRSPDARIGHAGP